MLRDPDSEPDPSPEPAPKQGNRSGGNERPDHDRQAQADDDATPVTRGNLQSKLTKALNKMPGDDDNWATVGALGNHLNRTDPSFDPRTYDFAKLSDLVKAQPYLETKSVQGSNGRSELWAASRVPSPPRSRAPVAGTVAARARARPGTTAEASRAATRAARVGPSPAGRAGLAGHSHGCLGTGARRAVSVGPADDATPAPAAETDRQQDSAPETAPTRETQVAASEEPTVPTEDAAPPRRHEEVGHEEVGTKKSAMKKAAAKKSAASKSTATKATAKKAAAEAAPTAATEASADAEPTPPEDRSQDDAQGCRGADRRRRARRGDRPGPAGRGRPHPDTPSSTTTVTTRTRKRATRKAGPAED